MGRRRRALRHRRPSKPPPPKCHNSARAVSLVRPYQYGIDLVAWVRPLQTNFGSFVTTPATNNQSPAPTTPSVTCIQVLDSFLVNLFATDLGQSQKDFLIDKIMMMDQSPRISWEFEWNQYRRTVSYPSAYTATQISNALGTVNWRLTTLMRYMLRMAEFHLS